jgi:Ca2+-binding EF-hand superfamily protein
VKPGLISIFKTIKENQHYFKKSDFEHMFEAYDFFEAKGGNQIPYTYLVQALEKIGIKYEKDEFLTKYPQFKLDRMVKKLDFINIMEAEYKKKISV